MSAPEPRGGVRYGDVYDSARFLLVQLEYLLQRGEKRTSIDGVYGTDAKPAKTRRVTP